MVSVEISKAPNGRTILLIDGKDVSDHIVSFSIQQNAHDLIPTLTITLPVSSIKLPKDFWADIEIKGKE